MARGKELPDRLEIEGGWEESLELREFVNGLVVMIDHADKFEFSSIPDHKGGNWDVAMGGLTKNGYCVVEIKYTNRGWESPAVWYGGPDAKPAPGETDHNEETLMYIRATIDEANQVIETKPIHVPHRELKDRVINKLIKALKARAELDDKTARGRDETTRISGIRDFFAKY